MKTVGPFVLVGIDTEGDVREEDFATLERAVAIDRQCSVTDERGPAWQCWAVWGNHPETEEWLPLVTSAVGPEKTD